MTIFQLNNRKGHKFLFSGLCFGFSMSRVAACCLRIAWAAHPTNVNLALAASIFVAAGVVLLFICNMLFAIRIIRSTHPNFGWQKEVSIFFNIYSMSILPMLIALITAVIQTFFTLSTNTRRIDHDIQLVGTTYFAVYAFMPIPMVLIALVIPRKARLEKFGSGRFRSKIAILLVATALLTLGAGFRSGGLYVAYPRDHPAWYQSKACFYLFNFTIDITVLLLFVVLRIDQRFHVPDGSKEPGDFSRDQKSAFRVKSEEEVFDDAPPPEERKDLEGGRQTA
jgi:hypothetical protein